MKAAAGGTPHGGGRAGLAAIGRNGMSTRRALVAAMAVALLGAGAAARAEAARIETADTASRNASGKFGRGIVNVLTGWGELIRCPLEITQDRGRLLGFTWGPLKGIAMTVIRSVVGVLETGLFFYPLPGNYDPMLQPEFIWPGDIFIKDAAPPASAVR